MLQRLEIQNFALIENLEIDFQSGFTTITGETGSGKSVMLQALGLLIGNRADSKALKNPEVKCVVEGEFTMSDYQLVIGHKELKEIVNEGEILSIRRVILPSGKSRAYVNEEPVKLEDLKVLGVQLVDIHSQHQNILLRDANFAREVVDRFAENGALLADYQRAYGEWRVACGALDEILAQQEQAKAEYEYNQHQLEVFEGLDGDLDLQALESEQELGAHGVEIEQGVREVESLIGGGEEGLDQILRILGSLESFYGPAKNWKGRMESLYLELQEIKREVESGRDNVDLDPERVTYVSELLGKVYGLMKRYNVQDVEALWKIRAELEQKVAMVEDFDELVCGMREKVEGKRKKVADLADLLSEKRQKVIPKLKQKIGEQLRFLGMGDSVIAVSNKKNVQECAGVNNEAMVDDVFGPYGIDVMEFAYAAHQNLSLRPLAQIASGGEVSRVMLVLKNILADLIALPTIIFDEIDTGVSGEVADRVGQMMRGMAENRQVFSISHLPQVAAKGMQQLKVLKEGDAVSAYTRIVPLGVEDRVAEIAQMISGSEITDVALAQARELLS